MTPEDEMILFAILQDIADELRRIEHEEQKAKEAKAQVQEQAETSNETVSSSRSFQNA
jgi:hypothetical protein